MSREGVLQGDTAGTPYILRSADVGLRDLPGWCATMESTLSTDRDGTLPAGKQFEDEQTTPLFLMFTPASGEVVDALEKSKCVPRGSADG